MCIKCYSVRPSSDSEDYWIPLKHQCNNINMCAMRIPYETEEQKQKIISLTTYLIAADLPFIQPLYEYFVLEEEIIIIGLQPSELLYNKLTHGYIRSESMQIQICYYIIMAILMLHRHRIPISALNIRDFVVFNEQYVCLSAHSLINIMNCSEWNVKQDIMLLIQVLLQIIDPSNKEIQQLIQLVPCEICNQEHIAMDSLKQILTYFQMKKCKNAIDEFCLLMLQQFNWKMVYDCSFLKTMALSPYSDDSKQIFRAWPCVNVVIKQKILQSLDTDMQISDIDTDQIIRQIKQLCKFFSAKYKCNRQFIEEILGNKKDSHSFKDNETNVMDELEPLEEFIKQIPISQYIESRITAVISQQTKTNLSQQAKYTRLHVHSEIDQNMLHQFEEGLNKCLKQFDDGTQMEIILLFKIKLFGAGIQFVAQNNQFPMDYVPIVQLVDIKNMNYMKRCFDVFNGIPSDQVMKQFQSISEYISTMHQKELSNNIEHLIFYFLVFMQIYLQQVTCILLQERLIKQSESIKSVQAILPEYSHRQLINEQYSDLYEEQKIALLKAKNIEKYKLEDLITKIVDFIIILFEILFPELLKGKIASQSDLFSIYQRYENQYTQSLIQQFGNTLLALNDLTTCCYIIQVVNNGSITRIKPCFLFNFKRSKSKHCNNQKQLSAQFNYFFIFQIIIMLTHHQTFKELLLLNLIAPDIYLYTTQNIQSQFIINSLLKNDYQEDITLPQQYILCECYKMPQRCQQCMQYQLQLSADLDKRREYIKNQQINNIVKQLNILFSRELHDMQQGNSQQFQQILYYFVQINGGDLDKFIEEVFKENHHHYLIDSITTLINDQSQQNIGNQDSRVSETLEIADLVPTLSYFKQAIYTLLTPTTLEYIASYNKTDVITYLLKLQQTLKGNDKYLIIPSYVKIIHNLLKQHYDRIIKLKFLSTQQIQQLFNLDDKEKSFEQLLFTIIGIDRSVLIEIINIPVELFSNLEYYVASPRQLPLQQCPTPSMDFVVMQCHISLIIKQIITIIWELHKNLSKNVSKTSKNESEQEQRAQLEQQTSQLLEKRLQQEQQIINTLTLRMSLLDDEISVFGCQLLQQSICQFIVAQNMFKRLCILEMIHVQLFQIPIAQVSYNYSNLILTLRNQYDDIKTQNVPTLFKNINNQMLKTIEENDGTSNVMLEENKRGSDPLTTQQLIITNKQSMFEASSSLRSTSNSQLATRLNTLDYQDLHRTVQPIISLLGIPFFAAYTAVLAELTCKEGFYTEEMPPPFRVAEDTAELLFQNNQNHVTNEANLILQSPGNTNSISKDPQILLPHSISSDILIMLRNCSKIQQIIWTDISSCKWLGRLMNIGLENPYDLYLLFVIQQIVIVQHKSEIVMEEIIQYILPQLVSFIVSSGQERKGDYATLQILLYYIIKNHKTINSKSKLRGAQETQEEVLPKSVQLSLSRLYKTIFNQTTAEQLEIRLNVLLIMLNNNVFDGFMDVKGPEKLIALLKTQMNSCRTLILQAISASLNVEECVKERYQALNTAQLLKRVPLDKSNKDGIQALNNALRILNPQKKGDNAIEY